MQQGPGAKGLSVAPRALALVQGGNHYTAGWSAFVSTFWCLESLAKYPVCGHLLALLEHSPRLQLKQLTLKIRKLTDPLLCVEWLEVISDEAGLSRHLTVRASSGKLSSWERGPTCPLCDSSRRPPGSPTWDARPQCAAQGKAHPGAQRGTTRTR